MIQVLIRQDGTPRRDHPTAQSPRGGDPGAGQNNIVASEAEPRLHARRSEAQPR
jgi:hypothetical protein